MGAVSGDKTKCECRPTEKVPDFPDSVHWPAVPLHPGTACTGGKVWSECAGCDFTCDGRDEAPCRDQCYPKCACPAEAPYWVGDVTKGEAECRTKAWCDASKRAPAFQTRR